MIKLAVRIIIHFVINSLALLAAVYFVEGFEIVPAPAQFLTVGAIFTFINIFIKPIIKLILSPLIIVTLGLGIILVNATILYFLDFYFESVIINGIVPLFYATIIISAVNFFLGFLAKPFYKK